MYSSSNQSTDDSITSRNSVYAPVAAPRERSATKGSFASKTSIVDLPSLPAINTSSQEQVVTPEVLSEEDPCTYSEPETRYIEFDFASEKGRRNTENLPKEPLEKVIVPHRTLDEDTDARHEQDSAEVPVDPSIKGEPDVKEDDFFNMKVSDWKDMKTIAEQDYYNDKGELEFQKTDVYNMNGSDFWNRAYTKIDTEEQMEKYAGFDRETDFLFKSSHPKSRATESSFNDDDSSDFGADLSDYEDDTLDTEEALQSITTMLGEAEKFAYVGTIKVITLEMATELAFINNFSSKKVAKSLSNAQRNFANWTMFILSKLYDHLQLTKQEQNMIENLGSHGISPSDIVFGLNEDSTKPRSSQPDSKESEEKRIRTKWAVICDLTLVLLSEGYYDSRSRTLLMKFAKLLKLQQLAIIQFERRLIESLEIDTNKKSIENKEELMNDKELIEKYIKKNKKARMAYIGLATVGGSLAIGLSAGLLAPVIGAGLAAGLTTVGIGGTAGFLGGVGGGAIITTTGVVAGAKIGSKAGSRRTGEIQTFEFKPLHNRKRTNLILTVSGWMNGKADDVRLPFSTIDPVMGDIFSLLWEPEMLQSMGQTINILASEALSTSIQQILGATILSALMSAIQLPVALTKLSYLLDNPWNVSLDRAWKAGYLLADALIAGNLGVRPITLVGFSLGARLVYSCLIELARRGGYGLVENVILLGSPVAIKKDQMALARSVVSGRFVNGYSKKDWVLGYLFRATGGGLSTVAGLSDLPLEGIENIDCTHLVDGHMSYRKAIPKILKILDWEILSEEFTEIEEPDPEQSEKQRKLIDELDEARAKMKNESEGGNKKKTWKDFLKPKEKSWWNFAGSSSTNNASGSSSQQESATAETDPDVEKTSHEPEPIFDLNALMSEVHEIEKFKDASQQQLNEIKNDTSANEPKLKLNEDTEKVH
ncbi:Piso0_003965 [Millerozyma farinosa CBS 7064]|uniref:Piso0_003965 protein n=1 Tax=Pichia sorbitophila (strain ATCC MYA-4447 / BCRC 22081 / CBS 7064 / NBRC 10061 / NRRL Y-12695) TaxID=559304 RepID=G8Y741_PICSO|nr:Piso0_003965 [Millerozyma farinosa CBS 7064]CCE84421.1 Piso0_003965 [Millerozyma farinosa CBS 7064]